MNSLTDFINSELVPALFENIDRAFPSMNFKRRGRKWSSPKHLDGADSSDGEGSYIGERLPGRIADRNGSRSLSLIDFKAIELGFAPGVRGAELIEVLRSLCSVCGLSVPEGADAEKFREYQERQEQLLRLTKQMREALFTPEGAEVLSYLKEGRGYSEGKIKALGVGLLTAQAEAELKGLSLLNSKADNIRLSYPLVIPYIANGAVKGFKFRVIKPQADREGKPLPKYKNSIGLEKNSSLFGITGANISGFGKERDVSIVEGELDALSAQAEGLPYVVAATGAALSFDALQELKRKGARYITLLFDTEGRDESKGETEAEFVSKVSKAAKRSLSFEEALSYRRAETSEKIERALDLIRQAGLRGFVAILPSPEGQKVDVDSYLRAHSAEELRSIIEEALPGAVFRFFLLRDKAAEKRGGEILYKDLERFKSDTIRLANEGGTIAEDRSAIFQLFAEATSHYITADDIQKEADELKAAQDKEEQERKAKELLSKSAELIREGKTEEALLLVQNGAGQLRTITREAEFSRYLHEDTEALFQAYKTQASGTETNIELSFGAEKYRLFLPSGALTIIGGATGHGKSRLLQSLALDLATAPGEEGIVLYVTYEENRQNVNRQLLNAFVDLELTTGNNEKTLQEYLQNGSTRFIKRELLPEFEKRLQEYKALRRRILRLIKPEDNSLETLEGLLKYAFRHSDKPIKAVFIDYIQEVFLESPKKSLQRTEELREISVSLDIIAQEESVPIVLAAQLKADVESPLTMRNQDIADSVNIPRKASEVLLIWSSAELPPKDRDGVEKRRIEAELPQLRIGERGVLYVKLTKSRLLPKGAQAFLTIHGNTGRVQGNAQPTLQEQEQNQGEPSQSKFNF